MFQLLTLAGTPVEIGRQHGVQIEHLRPLLMRVVETRLMEVRSVGADLPDVLEPARAALEEHDRPLLEFLSGLGETLELSPVDMLTYTLSSYLRDQYKVAHGASAAAAVTQSDGCTTWAAAAPYTVTDGPILAKNRDYHLDHVPLQLLSRVAPAGGYQYLSIGSAGSPHVFSSGINEQGLAIADTHVLSADAGPGLPRFSLMRAVLEGHATTQSALDYLRSVPHMGAGTLILADVHGHLAVCESGYRRCGYVEAGPGAGRGNGASVAPYLASANHFVTQELANFWMDDGPPLLQGNSPARRNRVIHALASSAGQVDIAWAQALMGAHGSHLDALCRHAFVPEDQPPNASFESSTISSVVFLPRGLQGDGEPMPTVWLADGQPCTAEWECWRVVV